ncbi:hypothetical protein CEXT_138671 [Caerostris extrusa]|uniref:Uncharacterized protein n=1 Tax=Caerostris extrusa TaxID=172846 RepID=A0AAV4UV86_CAEEX|nr:hypothetical protein CEXT_138671 [Caerostris extrusa]
MKRVLFPFRIPKSSFPPRQPLSIGFRVVFFFHDQIPAHPPQRDTPSAFHEEASCVIPQGRYIALVSGENVWHNVIWGSND